MIKYIEDATFEKEVINKKGVCLVDFYATWCGPCMMLSKELEVLENSRSGYNILKMDVDANQRVASELRIDVVPTLCIYKDGILVDKQVGYKNRDEIVQLVEKHQV